MVQICFMDIVNFIWESDLTRRPRIKNIRSDGHLLRLPRPSIVCTYSCVSVLIGQILYEIDEYRRVVIVDTQKGDGSRRKHAFVPTLSTTKLQVSVLLVLAKYFNSF